MVCNLYDVNVYQYSFIEHSPTPSPTSNTVLPTASVNSITTIVISITVFVIIAVVFMIVATSVSVIVVVYCCRRIKKQKQNVTINASNKGYEMETLEK